MNEEQIPEKISENSLRQSRYTLGKGNKSGYKGVSFCKTLNKWKSAVSINGKKIVLGYFNKIKDAIDAYDNKLIELFGQEAMTNRKMIELGLTKEPNNSLDIIPKIIENLPNEIWKDIVGWENLYQVSNLGRVKSFPYTDKRGHKCQDEIIMNQYYCKGHLTITLDKNGIRDGYYVHRLVAEAFIPNPSNFPQINHKNLIKDDNRVENLEWCNHTWNMRHA